MKPSRGTRGILHRQASMDERGEKTANRLKRRELPGWEKGSRRSRRARYIDEIRTIDRGKAPPMHSKSVGDRDRNGNVKNIERERGRERARNIEARFMKIARRNFTGRNTKKPIDRFARRVGKLVDERARGWELYTENCIDVLHPTDEYINTALYMRHIHFDDETGWKY